MTYPPRQHDPVQQPPVHGHVAWQHPPVVGGGGYPQQVSAATNASGSGRGLAISCGVLIAAVFAVVTMLLLQRDEPRTAPTSPATTAVERTDAPVIEQGTATGRLMSMSDTGITIVGHGGAGRSFTLDTSIQRAPLAALKSTRASVVVTFQRTADGTFATAVSQAPRPSANRAGIVGAVTFIDDSRLSVRAADGTVTTFTIAAKDRPQLDVPHLREHQQSGSPIRVFYDRAGGTLAARGYEDAA